MTEYKLAWANANAAKEIFEFIDKCISEANYYEKKKKGEIVDQLREAIQ